MFKRIKYFQIFVLIKHDYLFSDLTEYTTFVGKCIYKNICRSKAHHWVFGAPIFGYYNPKLVSEINTMNQLFGFAEVAEQ